MILRLIKKYLEVIIHLITNTQKVTYHVSPLADPFITKLAKIQVNLTKKESELDKRLDKEIPSKDRDVISIKIATIKQAKQAIINFLETEKKRKDGESAETRTKQLETLQEALEKAIKAAKESFTSEFRILFSGTVRLLKSSLNSVNFELKREGRKERVKAHSQPEPTHRSRLGGG